MLKIKNDIDLKELEKFGFKEKWIKQQATTEEKFIGYELEADVGGDFIYIKDDRTILASINYHTIIEDVLYDLIQADLVEKI